MKFYSQTNYNDQLGTGKYTIKQAGCKLTCVSMMVEIPPNELNRIFIDNNVYADSTGNLADQSIADYFKNAIYYNGYVTTNPNKLCMVETSYYKSSGYPQHFFLLLDNGMIWDPLLQEESTNHYEYNMVSFRLFSLKGESMDCHEYNAQIERTCRDDNLGHVDPIGSEANIKRMDEGFKNGDKYVGGNVIHEIYNSDEAKARRKKAIDDAVTKQKKIDQEIMETEVSKSLVACEAKCATTVANKDQQIRDLKDDLDEGSALWQNEMLKSGKKLDDCLIDLRKYKSNQIKDMSFWDKLKILLF